MKKKNFLIMCTLFAIFILTGCAGASDYEINLINGYHAVRTSADNIKIYKEDSKDLTGNAPSIPIYNKDKEEEFNVESIIKIGQDDRYILAETNKSKFYILDTKDETVLDFSDKETFEEKKKELGILEEIHLKDLDEYKKEY